MIGEIMKRDLLEYAKIDGEDDLAVSLYSAAVQLAESQTGKRFVIQDDKPKYPLYWLAIKMMVSYWYDNRGNGSDKNFVELPLSSRVILDHIAISHDFEEVAL